MPTNARLKSSRTMARFMLGAGTLTVVTMLSACASHRAATPGMISGRYIAALGDADMAASAFSTGELGDRDANAKDTLTVITLPIQEPETAFSQIEVSNSALGPANAMAVTSDGRYAFVAEYRGHAPDGAKTVDQLPKGDKVAAIDLNDLLKPKVIGSIFMGVEPSAVAVHPSGDMVAVVTGEPRKQIAIVEFNHGQFSGEPAAWPLIGLDNDESKATNVVWHPLGRALAVTLQERGEVMFYRFKRDNDGGLWLRPWGEPVKVGKYPYVAAFTPDGKYLLVSDFRAGPDGDTPGVGMPQGRVSVVRVADMPAGLDSSTGGPAGHVLVGYADVGVQPIGLAVSHDGKLVAASNLRAGMAGSGDAQQTRGGSVSLLSIDGQGMLKNLGEYPINAVPAGLAFDGQDKFLAVTQFRSFDPTAIDGEIAFFQIRGEGSGASLKACDFYVGAGKGPHGVLIVR